MINIGRTTLGHFTIKGSSKLYSMYFYRGYKPADKKYVYVGNSTQGNFFRFRIDDKNDMVELNHNGYSLKIYLNPSKYDLYELISMLFPGRNYSLFNLKYRSRKECRELIFVDNI